MTLLHLVLRYTHISMGMLALVSGAGAMMSRKGSALHRKSGNVFFVSMLIMAGTATFISIFIDADAGNIMGGSMAFYLTATGWVTVWRKPAELGRLEIGGALLGMATATAGITFGFLAAHSPTGRLHEYPPMLYFIFASVALLGTVLDLRMIARGGLRGAARTARHLWRMCFAMFIATGSFFLGQAKLFPAAVRESGVLLIPALLPIVLLVYWLIRVRLMPAIGKARALRRAAPHSRVDAAA